MSAIWQPERKNMHNAVGRIGRYAISRADWNKEEGRNHVSHEFIESSVRDLSQGGDWTVGCGFGFRRHSANASRRFA